MVLLGVRNGVFLLGDLVYEVSEFIVGKYVVVDKWVEYV